MMVNCHEKNDTIIELPGTLVLQYSTPVDLLCKLGKLPASSTKMMYLVYHW